MKFKVQILMDCQMPFSIELIVFNHLNPQDASKHHFASLKNDLF